MHILEERNVMRSGRRDGGDDPDGFRGWAIVSIDSYDVWRKNCVFPIIV